MKLTIEKPKTYRVTLVDYCDVWGNDQDGFLVNDSFIEWAVEVTDVSDEALLDLLKEKKYLNSDVTFAEVDFQEMGHSVEISVAETGFPLGCLNIVEV